VDLVILNKIGMEVEPPVTAPAKPAAPARH